MKMKDGEHDTPPSSVNGDEISALDDDMYFEEVEEITLDDDDNEDDMEMLTDQEEEDRAMTPPEDHAVLLFSKHVGSVFCCDLHPDGKLAVTGGEDDKAYVWSVETGQVIMDCKGHKDSVIYVGFSFDGTYLATADMAGFIKVWKVNTDDNQEWPIAFEYETDDLNWGLWHFGARVLVCGVSSGDIYVFKIPSGDTKVLQGHSVKVECGQLFKDGVRLVAGYEDGAVKVWDLKTCTVVNHIPANVHQIRVTAVDTHPENNLVASISTDGKMVLLTPNNGKIVGQFQAENELETVAFSQDPVGYLALGTLTGGVSIWDVARQIIRHHCVKADEDSEGVTKIFWAKNNLITGCLDGSIRIYDSRSGERAQMLTGHKSAILDLCYDRKKSLILTTSDDNTARIFKYDISIDND